jgi:hypothetical protein
VSEPTAEQRAAAAQSRECGIPNESPAAEFLRLQEARKSAFMDGARQQREAALKLLAHDCDVQKGEFDPCGCGKCLAINAIRTQPLVEWKP